MCKKEDPEFISTDTNRKAAPPVAVCSVSCEAKYLESKGLWVTTVATTAAAATATAATTAATTTAAATAAAVTAPATAAATAATAATAAVTTATAVTTAAAATAATVAHEEPPGERKTSRRYSISRTV
jgi:hypothetical protein